AQAGTYHFRGHKEDCILDKKIEVLQWDPANHDFSVDISRCRDSVVAIRLPHADGLEFYWTDGTMDSVRYVSEYGEFYFRAMNGTCREGVFTIEPDEDCERQECIVSIPNAVSPNGDGINEDLRLYAPGCSTIRSARLLDKWGNILYR